MKWHDGLKQISRPEKLRSIGAFLVASLSPVFDAPLRESKIAYLDGLRGFAAFLVYCTHHTAFAHDRERMFHHAFGFRGEYYLACLPVLRLFFAGGPFAVALFFTISGYALSVSPMRLVSQQGEGNCQRLATQLGCSYPRRWIRLYLPVVATTFLYMTSWHLFHIQSSDPGATEPAATYLEEFQKWLYQFAKGSYVFRESDGFGTSDYNPHMWSIAVEYRGSTIIYTVILTYYALGYGPNARFWACLGLFAYFQFIADGPYYALFIMGMLLGDVTSVWEREPHRLPGVLKNEWLRKHQWIYYISLLMGLYLGSPPHILDASNLSAEPGWVFLSYLVPSTSSNARWYFCVFSATLCMISIPRIPWLKRVFESSLFQYLGKISFGFYLVHGPVMWTVADRLNAAVGRPRVTADGRVPKWIDAFPVSDQGPLGFEMNFLLPHVIILPLTLWLGGVITKLVDLPSVKLSKVLFKQRSPKHRESGVDSGLEDVLPQYNNQPSR